MTKPLRTCAVAICDEPRIAGREYCAKHGPARGWTAPQAAAPAHETVLGSETGVHAGWYNDPLSSAAQRYWDGSTWTRRIRVAKKHPSAPWPGTDRPTVPADVIAHNRKLNIIIGSVAAGIVLIIVIAVVANSGGKSKSGGGGGNSASGFVSKIEQNSRATASDVTALINELDATSGSYDELTQIASDADTLHDHLADFYKDILTAANLSNSTQSALVDDEQELEHGVGAVHKWTGDPSASNNASWQNQLAKGIVGWNADVTTLWEAAGLNSPPTITVPTS